MARGLPPCKQRIFIRRLRALGFQGPFAGGKHGYMTYGAMRQTLPSYAEHSAEMVGELLAQVELIVGRRISDEEWASLPKGNYRRSEP